MDGLYIALKGGVSQWHRSHWCLAHTTAPPALVLILCVVGDLTTICTKWGATVLRKVVALMAMGNREGLNKCLDEARIEGDARKDYEVT